jgi:hypothetical protein
MKIELSITYFLFGLEAVEQYRSGKPVTSKLGSVYAFVNGVMHPSELLEAFDGWHDFTEISREEYHALKPLFSNP